MGKLFKKSGTTKRLPGWKLMIVDDDEQVHMITKIVLKDLEFMGRQPFFISAYSGQEAVQLCQEHPDTALILLDVVMETDHAGLDVVARIRNDLQYNLVRIVLRTGQPGDIPPTQVIVDYDINDFKEKQDLTSDKLTMSVISALRSYRDLTLIDRNKKALEKVLLISSSWFSFHNIDVFYKSLLENFLAIVVAEGFETDAVAAKKSIFLAKQNQDDDYVVVWGLEQFANCENQLLTQVLATQTVDNLKTKLKEGAIIQVDDGCFATSIYCPRSHTRFIVYANCLSKDTPNNNDLVNLYCSNAALAHDNIAIHCELQDFNNQLESRIQLRTEELEKSLARVEVLATTDHLTGISNRRNFLDMLDKEMQRARRYQRPLSIPLCQDSCPMT